MERACDEETLRIVNCVNSCWPEFTFTHGDIRKPTGDKFRELLLRFLTGFLGGNYQLPNGNMAEFSKNPEMFQHLEGNIGLYMGINSMLKRLKYQNLFYSDLIHPTPGVVREVLSVLVNFLAYYEEQEGLKEQIEGEVQELKMARIQGEKRLSEEMRYLDKCKQLAEEKKIQDSELRHLVLTLQEKNRNKEGSIKKLEEDVTNITKRLQSLQQRIEQSSITLNQLQSERDKAAEAVVPDPEELEAEQRKCQADKEALEENLRSLKDRLPLLEQQIQERSTQLQEHTNMYQRLTQIKARESKIKAENSKAELECNRVEEDNLTSHDQLKKENSIIESKKRMLEQSIKSLEQLRSQTEKTRSELKQCLTEENERKIHQDQLIQTTEKTIIRLNQELQNGQKALSEGLAVSEAIDKKFHQDMEEIDRKGFQLFQEIQNITEQFK